MIEAIGLTSRRGGTTVLRDVSFEAVPGQVTGLVTPDGVTDALVLRLMVQLARGGGRTLFRGRSYRRLAEPMREVGVLLRPEAGRRRHSARDHLRLAASAGGLTDGRVEEVLDLVGLTRAAEHPLKQFSPGMLRRLGVAVAVLGDPRALLLRDPLRGLESRGRDWICDFVRAYAAQGRTVLVTGSHVAPLVALADQLVHIDEGGVVANGPTRRPDDSDHERPPDDAVLVTSPHVERLTALLAEAGARVTKRGAVSLEVRGLARGRIGRLALTHQVLLDELTTLPRPPRESIAVRDPDGADADTAEHVFDFAAFEDAAIRFESDATAEPRARRVLDRIMANAFVASLFDLTGEPPDVRSAARRGPSMPPPGTALQYRALEDTQEIPVVSVEPPEPRGSAVSLEVPIVPVVPPAAVDAADVPATTN